MKGVGLLILRLFIGIGILAHSYIKLKDLHKTNIAFKRMGYAPFLGSVVAWSEFFIACLLIIGIFVRLAGILLAILMLGVLFHHWKEKDPFIGGWELPLLYFVCAMTLFLSGSSWLGF